MVPAVQADGGGELAAVGPGDHLIKAGGKEPGARRVKAVGHAQGFDLPQIFTQRRVVEAGIEEMAVDAGGIGAALGEDAVGVG